MNTVPQILADVKTHRRLDAHLDEISSHWHKAFLPALSQLPIFILLAIKLSMDRKTDDTIDWIILGAMMLYALISVPLTLRKRERAWLALIASEAPELHKKILDANPR